MTFDPMCFLDHVDPIDYIPWDRVQDNKTTSRVIGVPELHMFGFVLL